MVSIWMYKGARTYYIIAAIRNDACKNINYHFATTIIHLKYWFPSSLCFLTSSSMPTWRHTYYLYARYIVMWLETHRSASRAIRYRTLTYWKRKLYMFLWFYVKIFTFLEVDFLIHVVSTFPWYFNYVKEAIYTNSVLNFA